jgi:hypothetical protein
MKPQAYSDAANTDNPEIPHTRRPKQRPVFRYDEAGRCCGGHFRAMQEGEQFVFPDHTAFPLDRNDIIMPPLWPLDADGRGLSVLEHEGIASLHRTERAIARMVAEHLRAA